MTVWMDYTLLALLALAVPPAAVWDHRRMMAKLAAGDQEGRLRAYRTTIFWQWGFAVTVLVLWMATGRSWAELGLGLGNDWRFWTVLAVAVALGVGSLLQERGLASRPEAMDSVRSQLESLRDFLPQTRGELAWFSRLSITAGICEEVIYRGFLIWLLTPLWGLWPAVLGSSLIFGLGHTYQGPKGVLKTTVVGLVVAALYVFSGSLLGPILLHAAMDLSSGRIAYIAFGTDTSKPLAAPA